MIRKPAAARSEIVATNYPVPAWLRDEQIVASDPPFAAGAALGALDRVMREEPPWSGVWVQRLVLRAAAGACRHLGRTEDEAALRDLWMLRTPGSGFGPAGAVLLASTVLPWPKPWKTPSSRTAPGVLGWRRGATRASSPSDPSPPTPA
jgi:hypothetical protein